MEVAFADARQILGVGQARNRARRAVEHTVPFGLICLSLVTVWYATAELSYADHGHQAPPRVLIGKLGPGWARGSRPA
jgi:hypothetical protein